MASIANLRSLLKISIKKSLGFLLTLVLILNLSCGKKELKLSDLQKHNVNFKTKSYTSSKNNFTMSIPSNWAFMTADETYGHYIETFTDTIFNHPTENLNLCIISVETFKSGSNSLESTFDSLLNEIKMKSPIKLVESGKTDCLKYESYFMHLKSSTKTSGEIEMFAFILKGRDDFTYYTLSFSAPQYKNNELKDNLTKMLICIKSFEYENTSINSTINADSLKIVVHKNPNCTLTLYNNFGQLVLRMDSVDDEKLKTELNSRENGIYSYDVETKGEILSKGLLTIN